MLINLEKKFLDYITENELVTPNDKVLLTVSGGVDSMVLMRLFANSGYAAGVAHCNFQLRGEESDEDEVLVREQAAKYNLELFNIRFDTKAEMARTGESMEMAARRLRYDWFDELCNKHGYTAIAIAHHADDSIETFFINLLRGTGLRGLTGITNIRGRVFRPLMFASRKEILEYAHHNNIPFREDSSNRSTKYLRNKIRLGLIPRIREINNKFTSLMSRNLERLSDAQLFINRCIDKIHDQVIEVDPQSQIHTLHIDRIDPAYPKSFVVYELLSTRYNFKGDVVDSLLNTLKHETSGRKFYSKEWVAYSDRGNILITKIEDSDPCEVQVAEGAMRGYCSNAVIYFETLDIDMLDSYVTPDNVALFDADKIKYPLTMRRWAEGDSFVPFGMSGRKKVSDTLIDLKVSMPEKERQFVMLSGDDIIWVIGRRTDDRYKITRETENVLRVIKREI